MTNKRLKVSKSQENGFFYPVCILLLFNCVKVKSLHV